MTLKHIGFYDSPVMRELARQGIEKGTVSSQDVSSLIKKAKSKDTYAASGNVFNDMLLLANGLRDKGYVREAKVLEEKILNHKIATTEFSKILDEAHPEGDVEVADAEDDYGVVETIVTIHEHILEKINKTPTAKQAFISNVLKIAEGILKGGQSAVGPKDDHLFKIDSLNKIAKEVNFSVNERKDLINSIPDNLVLFTKENVLYHVPLFAKYAKLDGSMVTRTLQIYNGIYGGKEPNYKTVYSNLKQKSPAEQKQYCSLVNVSIYDSLLDPNREDKDLSLNPLEIGRGLAQGYTEADLQKAATALHNAVLPLFESTFGDTNLNVANENISKQIQEIKNNALTAINSVKISTLEYTATSNSIIIEGLNHAFSVFKSFYENKNINTLISEINSINKTVLNDLNFKDIINVLTTKIVEAASFTISKSDEVITKESAENIAGTFAKIFNLVMELIKNDEENKEYLSFRDTLNSIYSNLKSVIDDSPVITSSKLLNAVKSNLPTIASMAELQQTAADWLAKTQALTSESSIDLTQLKKEGQQPAAFPLSNSPKPGAVKSVSPSSKVNPQAGLRQVEPGKGTFSGKLDDNEKIAVKKMQALLVEIGNKYNDPSLTAVGKDGSVTPDGAWGKGTADILEKTKKLMSDKGVKLNLHTGPSSGFGYGGHPDVISKAKQNTIVLETFLGKQPGEGTASAQNFQIGKIPGLNNVIVMTQDFASLSNLYDMFVRAGITPEVDDENVIGIPFYTFYNCMLTTYNTVKSWYESNKKDFAGGYQIMNNRMREFVNFSSANAFLDKTRTNMLNTKGSVTKEALKGSSKQITPNNSESGAGFTDTKKVKDLGYITLSNGVTAKVESWLINGRPTKVYVDDDGVTKFYVTDDGKVVQLNSSKSKNREVDDGDDVEMSQKLVSPFTKAKNINLQANIRYFPKTRNTIGKGYLYLDRFYSNTAETLAMHLFSNSGTEANARKALTNFLNQLSKEITDALRIFLRQGATEDEGRIADDIASEWQERINFLLANNQGW